MPKGQRLGGRQKGTLNKKTVAHATALVASGLTPLDYMLGVLRDENATKAERLEAAKYAAPYMHPRLNAIDATVKGEVSVNMNDVDIARRIAFILTKASLDN